MPELTPVDRVAALPRARFLEDVRMRRPVIVEGGARDFGALGSWSLDGLCDAIGDAQVRLSDHAQDPRAKAVVKRPARFRDYARQVQDGSAALYLANSYENNFWVNPEAPLKPANPGLAPLARDFQLPGFLREPEVLFAQLLLGSDKNATRLHHDWGGESKCLVQLSGRKDIRLFPPAEAARLAMNPLFPCDRGWPGSARADVRASGAGEDPALRGLRGFEAALGPGDVLYWPSFWLHDAVNLERVNLAVVLALEEVRFDPLLLRYAAGIMASLALAEDPSPEEARAILRLFEKIERRLLSEPAAGKRRLFDWSPDLRRLGLDMHVQE